MHQRASNKSARAADAMPAQPNSLPRSFWIGASLTTGILGLALLLGILTKKTPPLPVLGQVADFTLTNQNGKISTLADFTNHVWLADIIFTRCAGPCPRLTQQMKSLTEKISAPDVKFVSLTTDPEFDTPEHLKKYGEHFDADFRRWSFLTGEKMQIALLGANSLKLAAQPVKPEEQKDAADLFIHTTIFVLVDKHAQLRATFETGGDGVDWTNDVRPKIISTVQELEQEP
jgi:protein SCO1